ncbi:MAG: MFS transporter [Caulobacterales bacterium]
MADPAPPTSRSLMQERDYLRFWVSRFTGGMGTQMQSVVIGWQIYNLARRSMDVNHAAFLVGMVGLATFAPLFLLALPAGETADRHDRKAIMIICLGVELAVAAGLALASQLSLATTQLLLGAAAVFGAARAYLSPANTALGPMLVPRELLPRSIAWNSLAGQLSTVAGSLTGGVLVAVSPALAYGVAAGLYAISSLAILLVGANVRPAPQTASRLELIRQGLVYVWRNRVVFGAVSLDLFAVLLGGATALLPVFAMDVLHVGSTGFGVLRASTTIGAAAMALFLASHPIRRHAGVIMFLGVATFGAATVVFGLSRSLWLSVAALAVLGAADMLSVFVRQTLVQLVTPDPMRGRVAAFSTLFISASNELGEFESGVVARFLGPIGSAIFGGVGALIVTGVWARLFPALRTADRLE